MENQQGSKDRKMEKQSFKGKTMEKQSSFKEKVMPKLSSFHGVTENPSSRGLMEKIPSFHEALKKQKCFRGFVEKQRSFHAMMERRSFIGSSSGEKKNKKESSGKMGESRIHLAARAGNLSIVKEILENCEDDEAKALLAIQISGETPLCAAIENGM